MDTSGYVILDWTSKGGATVAHLVESSTAGGGNDSGPDLAAHGETSMPFDCSAAYDYYTLTVHAQTTHAQETLQVANPS